MAGGAHAAAIPALEPDDDAIWRAVANPLRRRLLDVLSRGPRTTGQLAAAAPELSRFAIMQHLDVLTRAGLVLVRRRGRYRFNHLNAVPLRRWYERWVVPLADGQAAELLSLERHLSRTEGEKYMAGSAVESVRVVRVDNELRFQAAIERVFNALTQDTLAWFPHTYGEERVRQLVLEPRVGGLHYEDWGEGGGHLYAQVTQWDPPHRFNTRGRLMPGTTLDATYELSEDGGETVLRASKVAVGPLTEEEAAGIRHFGDLGRFEKALRQVIEGAAEDGER